MFKSLKMEMLLNYNFQIKILIKLYRHISRHTYSQHDQNKQIKIRFIDSLDAQADLSIPHTCLSS